MRIKTIIIPCCHKLGFISWDFIWTHFCHQSFCKNLWAEQHFLWVRKINIVIRLNQTKKFPNVWARMTCLNASRIEIFAVSHKSSQVPIQSVQNMWRINAFIVLTSWGNFNLQFHFLNFWKMGQIQICHSQKFDIQTTQWRWSVYSRIFFRFTEGSHTNL